MTIPEIPNNEQQPLAKKIRKNSTKRVLVSGAENPHQVMTAGQTISFVLLTLLIGAFLNSSSLYTKASTKKPSWSRTATMTVLRPFDLASEKIGLNSARRQTRSALDLPRDDKVDTFTFELSDNKPEVRRNVAAPLPVLGNGTKLRTWIIGDSLSIIPGESMQRKLPADSFSVMGLQGKVSTGFARPDVFNWFTYIDNVVNRYKPKLIIATFGTNDDQYLFGSSGPIGPFGSKAWKKEYSTRVASTLDFLANKGAHVVWIEIPPVRDKARNNRYKIINSVIRKAVEARPASSTYVKTATAFAKKDGSYTDAKRISGTPTLLRASDGIHLTRSGGDKIADLVLEKLHTVYTFK